MLDISPSPGPLNFAFSSGDEISIRGVAYRALQRRENGHILIRADGEGLAELFDHGKLSHLASMGLVSHRPAQGTARIVEPGTGSLTSTLPDLLAGRVKFRHAFVEAFLGFERAGLVKRTDVSIRSQMLGLQKRAGEIMGLNGTGNTCKMIELPKEPSASRLRAWLKSYEREGIMGLCDARTRSGNRTRRIGLEELRLLADVVERYASASRPTKHMIFRDVEIAFTDANMRRVAEGRIPLEKPSRETVRREIDRLDPYTTYLNRYGADAARKRYAPVGRGLQLTRPLERVEMDEWTIDLMSFLASAGILERLTGDERETLGLYDKKGRWMLTVAICATTRCIVAMRMSRTASAQSAIQTIEMITQDKGVWADHFGALSPWEMRGTPEAIVTDCGPAFIGYETRSVLQDLGIIAERAPAGFPEMRARVERLFRTMSISLLPRLTGRTFSDVVEKGDSNPEARTALTTEELSEALVRWIVDVYHNTPHEGLNGETPAACWRRLVAIYGVRPAPDMTQRRLIFGTRMQRQLTKKGIRIFGIWYHGAQLADRMLRNEGRQCAVRWHPDDLGAIAVELDGNWHEITAVQQHFSGVRAEQWFEAAQDLRAGHRAMARVSETAVHGAFSAIDLLNAHAMRREGLLVRNWTADNMKRIEERLFVGFEVSQPEPSCETDSVPGQGIEWGYELPTAASADDAAGQSLGNVSVNSPPDAPSAYASVDIAQEASGGDGADEWTNEAK